MKTFTPKEQATHCSELADRLKRQPKSAKYNHGSFTCGTAHCALGWAAVYGIGGLVDSTYPHLPGASMGECSDIVFGDGAWDYIFSCCRDDPDGTEPESDEKALSIHRLREQAKRLLKAVP